MQLETKAQIAKASLSLLTLVTFLFLLGILVLVLCVGLQINPFRETTTSFLGAVFAGLTGIAAVLVLLNVATNVSLIADAKIAELKIDPQRGVLKKWSVAFFVVAAALVCFIFLGTYLSKERYLGVVRAQADEVLKTNNSLLDKLAFYRAEYFDWNQPKSVYVPTYFACTRNLDCDYLTRFFSDDKADVLQKYTMRNDQFYIYIPYRGSAKRFVLLFDRRNSYGKIGS
jgi:hypothetical protein